MKTGTVYIKAEQSSQVVNKKIMLKDVMEICSTDITVKKEIENLVLYSFKGDKNEKKVFSIVKVIDMVGKRLPGITVSNIGEPDFIVEYKMPVSSSKIIDYTKLVLVCLVTFFGAAFTIMTFNTDVSVGDVFGDFYYMVMGAHKNEGSVLEVSYSIGIPLGILGFYNHFKGEKIKDDPTPIHIEMRTYEKDMNNAIIQDASREGREEN